MSKASPEIAACEILSDLADSVATLQREVDAAAVSLRQVFGPEYSALGSEDMRLVTADYVDAFRAESCTAGEYRRRIGTGNLASYARTLRATSR